MRFKNLTITLTLTCLSIVALAGLVLLPITNGICASWTSDSFGGKSLSDSYNMDQTHRGWSLYASVSAGANTASASASPSITGPEDFTETYAWIGYANTYAQVNACTVYRLKRWSKRYHDEIELDPDSDSASGEIRAKVVIAMQAWGSADVLTQSDPKVSTTINAPIGVFGEVNGTIEFGETTYKQISIVATYDQPVPVDKSESQECSVSGSSRAGKGATVSSFWFGTQSIAAGKQVSDASGREDYDDATATYSPPPLDYGFVEGSMGWIISAR